MPPPASAQVGPDGADRLSTDSPALRALLDVSVRLEMPVAPGDARAALAHALARTSTALEHFAAAATELGLRAAITELTPAQAVAHAGARTLLATPLPTGGWIVLADRRTAKIFRPDALGANVRRVGARRLSQLLGNADADAGREWLALEPLAALTPGHADDHATELTPARRLGSLLWPERGDLLLVMVYAVGVGVLALGIPVAVQALVNFVAFGGLMQPVIVLGLLLLAILAFAAAIRSLKAIVVELIQRRIFVRVVADLAYRLPRVRIETYDRNHGPELVNRFFDVMTVQKASATLLLDGVGILLQAVIGLLILAFYHPFLLWFDLVLLATIGFIIFGLGRGAVRTAIEESKCKYAVAASLEEIARNPLMFKLAGGPHFAQERADALTHDYLVRRRQHFAVVFRQLLATFALQAVASTALLTLGGWLVIRGELTLGQLVAAELIVTVVLASIAKLGKQLDSIYDLLAAVDKLGHLIDLPLERLRGEARPEGRAPAALQLTNVSYHYEGGVAPLEHFTLHVQPGEKVAIIGRHGSGKSTLADLIYGLRAPAAGRIQLDGVDLREFELEALRDDVALVKGLEVVEGDILENVRMRRMGVSYADARAALEQVGLLDAVQRLPMGLRTELNSLGAPLSYTQTRLLMLARAIVAKPRLLVLDDVMDDLDPAGRAHLNPTLFAPDAPWTLIVLANDPHATTGCDRAVILPNPGDGPDRPVRAVAGEELLMAARRGGAR